MKETFGNSGGEGRFIFLHKSGNSGEVGILSWNSLRGGGMDIFWNYTFQRKQEINKSQKRINQFEKSRKLQWYLPQN